MSDTERIFKADAFTTESRLCRFSYLSYKWTYGCSTECNGMSEYNEVLVTGLGWYTTKKKYLGGFGGKEENIEKRRGLLLYSGSVVSLKYWMTLLWKGSCPQIGIKIQVSFFLFKFVFVFPLLVCFSPYLYWEIIDK